MEVSAAWKAEEMTKRTVQRTPRCQGLRRLGCGGPDGRENGKLACDVVWPSYNTQSRRACGGVHVPSGCLSPMRGGRRTVRGD